VSPDSSWNTAVSFASNTNWQGYGGETTMSYLTQMLGMTVQNFVSAATGMAVLVALIRGISRHTTKEIGNFWVDMTRSTLYILLPLSLVLHWHWFRKVSCKLSASIRLSLIQPSTGT
jgi:K+-transporting ATPase ATPase A chain